VSSALDGIKVIDVSQVAAAPMAARILGDFGADVIHVENPAAGGDAWRYYQQIQTRANYCAPSEFNYNWENFNRNKRSVTINLYTEGGRKIIHRMAETADVFITNLRVYELERFELTYERLRQINPKLVYGHLSGYGSEGPERDRPSFDYIAYWARTGFEYMLGVGGIPCLGYRAAMGDNVAALALACGVMLALYVREKTGVGQQISVSLQHVGLYQISFDISGALITGLDAADWREMPPVEVQQKAQEAISEVLSFYRKKLVNPLDTSYVTKDNRVIHFFAVRPDRYWERFCRAIGRDDLATDPRFSTFDGRAQHGPELYQTIAETIASKTLEEWRPLLKDIPCGPVQTLKEAINDPQARASGCFVSYEHPKWGRIEQVANPIRMSMTPATVRVAAPELGEHTEEVLLEIGYSSDDILDFRKQGAIG
jgi:crotonobetainyl-CoA:carnitine CoA-transferase CaiB-like acyl-CoA transferase